MKQLFGAVLAATLLVSGAAFAVDLFPLANGSKFLSYNSTTRVMTVQLGLSEPFTKLGCTIDASVSVPPTLATGRNVAFSYTGAGAGQPGAEANNGNKCSNIALQ
ncbi:MAG: hypothetical protein EXQ88_06695 [Alphaproteobacteria bacterium]|nr:hypothetical protein [Alphaproteobacteria bacterium]